jgi:putative ABC transport system substrate-binding protein
MKRRAFITLLGGAAAASAWPRAARAQERVRRIGIVMGVANDAEGSSRIAVFTRRLAELGWVEGRNLRTDIRWGSGDTGRAAEMAAEVIATNPDVIVINSVFALIAAKEKTRAIPIVFLQAFDPVKEGIVANLARPGGNITGFTQFVDTMEEKWLEVLKQIAPSLTRVAFLHAAQNPTVAARLQVAEAAGATIGVRIVPAPIRNAQDVERVLGDIASAPNGGLIVSPSNVATVHRELIAATAIRLRLPAIYPYRYYATSGGLLSYGFDPLEHYRGAASYVDRILRGANPGELPIQQPAKFELVVNLKTAKAMDIEIPPTLLVRADEVIE